MATPRKKPVKRDRLFREQSAANHPGLSDEEILRIIGSDVLLHQQHGEEGRIGGKTWQQRFPSYNSWLKKRKLTVDDALAAFSNADAEAERTFTTGKRVGLLALGNGQFIEEHMAMPTFEDRLAGRATRQDVALYSKLARSQPEVPEFSPVLTSVTLIGLLKLNGILSNSRQSLTRFKKQWQAKSEPGSNDRRFRFHLATLRELGVKYPAEWK